MAAKKDDLGEVLNGVEVKEAAVWRHDAQGVPLAEDRPDRGPSAALRPVLAVDPRTGQPRRYPPKRVLEILRREVGGRAVDCAVVVGPLRALYRNGTISADQYSMGVGFKAAFDYAGLQGMRACDMERVSSGRGSAGHGTDVGLDARDYVWRCMQALGGPHKITSRALWTIVGLEFSLRDIEGEMGRGQKFWSAALVMALDGLVGNVPVWQKGLE